ncbi:HAD family hydrolase [Maribacter algarum]|uniref:HAD family hydrolase n=1 Tax=Maribacter algarum (ex Zhang et al. 2020) TaxID=2578118 RepID=A0A5S3PHQ3_9FLAO|nr:HAD family hydrolase [Maribacter algarum]TMM53804.1 HAD family hydrolase [Maribacter algarum]
MDIKVDQNTVIVFDLDDTLYNEIDYLKSAYTALAKDLEPENWEQLYANLFSLYRNNENPFKYVSENFGVSTTELIELYRDHIPNITPFEGVLQKFQIIKDRKGKIAILTDGRSKSQRNKINALGLIPYLDYIVISEEIGSEKPDKKNFKSIENHFKVKNYYYIGDNLKKDFITPNQRGWQTIALLDNGLNIHSNAYLYNKEEHLPHNYVLHFDQLNFI